MDIGIKVRKHRSKKGERQARKMAEENESPKCIECEEKDDYKQIQKLQILRTLLKCLKDVNCEYPLSAVLEYSREECPKDVLLQGILQLADEAYVSIKPRMAVQENETPVTAKQLIEVEEYDNILILLQEQESGILLRGFVDANISMLEVKSQFGEAKQKILSYEKRLKQYEESYQTITKLDSDVRKYHEDFNKDKVALEEEWKTLEQRLTTWQKTFEASILEKVKKKAADKIEEELTQRGKIGSAMQDAQKNIIQFMAIFVAIFSLVSVNITNVGKWSYTELFRVNVIMTTSMFTLVALIFIFTTDNSTWIKRLLVMVSGLWIVLAATAGISMCL